MNISRKVLIKIINSGKRTKDTPKDYRFRPRRFTKEFYKGENVSSSKMWARAMYRLRSQKDVGHVAATGMRRDPLLFRSPCAHNRAFSAPL